MDNDTGDLENWEDLGDLDAGEEDGYPVKIFGRWHHITGELQTRKKLGKSFLGWKHVDFILSMHVAEEMLCAMGNQSSDTSSSSSGLTG